MTSSVLCDENCWLLFTGGKLWFDSYDCASFVLRAFAKLGDLGTKFNSSVHLNYTRIHLYADEPVYLGNASVIFGPAGNKTLAADIIDFYRKFQSHQTFPNLIKNLVEAAIEIWTDRKFYLFYNFEYWLLPMRYPYVKLTYYESPLPETKDTTLRYKNKPNWRLFCKESQLNGNLTYHLSANYKNVVNVYTLPNGYLRVFVEG